MQLGDRAAEVLGSINKHPESTFDKNSSIPT
jgi:hypothetical protein